MLYKCYLSTFFLSKTWNPCPKPKSTFGPSSTAQVAPGSSLLSSDQACIPHSASFLFSGHSHQGGPCPRGHFCPSGTSHPQPCPPGSYSNLTGQASCFPCPAGYYCPENITTYSGHPCPAGFYCPRGECLGHSSKRQGQ